METLTNCPICSETKFSPFLSCADYTVSRETFHIVQCHGCGFRFTNPRPDEKEIGKYYESEKYISHSGTNKGIVNKLYRAVRNHTIKQKVKLIGKLLPTPNSQLPTVLDIGCGTGEFLNACQKNNWGVTGIEPSETARANAKSNFGIAPYESLWDLSLSPLGREGEGLGFSIITMWHVLEHVHQLDKTIEQIKKILLWDGVLIIALPNCNSFDAEKYCERWAGYDVPRHIYHFTKKDIEKLFARFDFCLKEILPMKFDSYYVSLLSEKYKTGNPNLVAGFLSGLTSNLLAGNEGRGYSSQIYILKIT